jgi:hypothetical protein
MFIHGKICIHKGRGGICFLGGKENFFFKEGKPYKRNTKKKEKYMPEVENP